jgi:hypothetical protein
MRDQTWQKQKQLVEHDPLPVLSRAEVAEALCCYKVNLAYSENHYKLKKKNYADMGVPGKADGWIDGKMG